MTRRDPVCSECDNGVDGRRMALQGGIVQARAGIRTVLLVRVGAGGQQDADGLDVTLREEAGGTAELKSGWVGEISIYP